MGLLGQEKLTTAHPRIGEGLLPQESLAYLGQTKVTTAQAGSGHLKPVGLRHGSKVDRQVRGVGHKRAIRPKQGAREVQALLDVDTDAGALQCAPHLLCNAHEPAQIFTGCVIADMQRS